MRLLAISDKCKKVLSKKTKSRFLRKGIDQYKKDFDEHKSFFKIAKKTIANHRINFL